MKYIKGNILEEFEKFEERCDLIHQVNCQGVMGAGLAKAIRDKYPNHYIDYKHMLGMEDHIEYVLGDCFPTWVGNMKYIVGVYGQARYGRDKRHTNYAALSSGLCKYISASGYGVTRPKPTLLIPKGIGCGLGGGDWNIVEILLKDIEDMYNVEFTCVELEK